VTVAGSDGRPRWSAAGELLFSGTGADTGRVFAVSPDGGTPRAVASVPGRSPTLSPDGTRVLYLVGPWTSTALVVAEVDGSHARTLAGGGTTAWNGAWSPDGKLVAYTYGDSSRVLQVHVVNADGGGDRAVTRTTPAQGSAQMPAWSPEGHRLAVQVNSRRAHSSEIWIVDVPNGEIRRLSAPGAQYLDETPCWFPDGTRLAFQSNRTGTMEVWVMAADGSSPRQITGDPGRSPGE
jgi:Tol biopolymer transport system component